MTNPAFARQPHIVETMNENAKIKSETLKAPMQAVVHQLNVAVGDIVAANAELVVLEAMKMHHGLAVRRSRGRGQRGAGRCRRCGSDIGALDPGTGR